MICKRCNGTGIDPDPVIFKETPEMPAHMETKECENRCNFGIIEPDFYNESEDNFEPEEEEW